MSRPIVIRPDAQDDIREAGAWYGDVRDRNGKTFIDALDDAFDLISEHPEAFQMVYRSARRYVLKRFPYNLIYVVTENAVEVIALVHGSRRPKVWKRRVS